MRAPARRPLALAAALALSAAACGGQAAGDDGSSATTPARLPDLPRASTLATAAEERAEELCDARAVRIDAAAPARYDQETWSAVVELTGRATVAAPGDAAARDAARAEVEASWAGEPALVAGGWDQVGTGEVVCGDDRLYVVTALARAPSPADAGDYATVRFAPSDIRVREGLRYGTAPAVDGAKFPLELDVYSPPRGTGDARPTLVLVHGGGFTAGTRSTHAPDALAYARRGFVAVVIDYRLDPFAGASAAAHRAASQAAIDDGMEAVRWLRAHADAYGIDPDRIAALGASAGGEIALGVALLEDLSPTGPYRDESPRVAAAVSTGAYLTPVLGTSRLDEDDAPVLLHYFETDTASGRPWTYAASTCEAVRAAGTTCDLDVSPGAAHTVGLGPTSAEADRIAAFLAVHLDLADG